MIYIIAGDDSRELQVEKIIGKIKQDNPGVKEKYFDAAQNEQEAFVHSISFVNMFGGQELIVLKRAENVNKLANFFDMLGKFNIVNKDIIIDMKKKLGKKEKENAKSLGKLLEVANKTENDNIRNYVQEELGISSRDAHDLLEMIGTDIQKVRNEVDKIQNYLSGETFELSKIRNIVSIQKEFNIFEIIEEVLNGKVDNALQYLQREKAYMLFLYNIASEFKTILKLKLLEKEKRIYFTTNYNKFKYEYEKVKENLRTAKGYMHPYAVFKKLGKINKFSEEQLKQALADVLQAELDIKTGNKKDDMAVELLIMKIMKMQVKKR